MSTASRQTRKMFLDLLLQIASPYFHAASPPPSGRRCQSRKCSRSDQHLRSNLMEPSRWFSMESPARLAVAEFVAVQGDEPLVEAFHLKLPLPPRRSGS